MTTRRPGYNIDFHPRAFSKPLACLGGIHKGLKTIMLRGLPTLYCTKCGQHLFKGVAENTMSKNDALKHIKSMQQMEHKTKKQMLKESWKKLERLRQKNSDKAISKYVRRKLLSGGAL